MMEQLTALPAAAEQTCAILSWAGHDFDQGRSCWPSQQQPHDSPCLLHFPSVDEDRMQSKVQP